jgi:acetyl esterase/lipase
VVFRGRRFPRNHGKPRSGCGCPEAFPQVGSSTPARVLVYVHGGGFTHGTLDESEAPMRLIAEHAGIVTYIVTHVVAKIG